MPKHKKSSKNSKKKSRESSSKKVKVVNVTTSDQAEEISKKLKNGKSACVIYLMEGCPHCVTLKETLHHEVEPSLKNRMGNMIVKIHSDLMDHLNVENKNVEGFPTITVVKHGKQTQEHRGERNLDALLEFLANSNVIDDIAMAGGAKRKTRKLRKRKTLTKKVRRCCRSCKTCSKCSCKCKKSCKCKCKCKSRKSRKSKRRKHKGGRPAEENQNDLLNVKMYVDFGNNNDAIAAFNNDHAKHMIEHYFENYFFHTYQDSDPILINSINYVPNNHSITFLVQKDFKDKILGVDAEDIGLELEVPVEDLENNVTLFFKNFVSFVLKDPLARLEQFSFTDNNIDHEVSFYPYNRPDRIEVNEVN